MKSWLTDRQGATSVLVIFMMIVLVVFATLAFTTSYANYSLSQKASVITQENYALDTLAMRMTLYVDTALADAEVRAQNVMRGDVAQGRIEGFTLAQGEVVRTRVAENAAFLSELMNRLYMTYAVEELTLLIRDFDGVEMILSEEYADGRFLDFDRAAPDEESLRVTLALTTGDNQGDKQLDVALAVAPLRYDLKASGASASGGRAEGFVSRYRVDAWKQWQIPFVYDDGLQFGDARITVEE